MPEPYYNEPSYEQYRNTEDGRLSSKQYNESAFLLTLRSILSSCRNPPRHFAELVSLIRGLGFVGFRVWDLPRHLAELVSLGLV